MKLHLPVRLFRAVIASCSLAFGIASSCHISSAAVPEGYKEFIIVTEGDLTNMEPTLGNRAFLVKADLLFDKLSSPFMTGTAESWYFSCLPGVSVIFENATDGVFDVAASQRLTFTEFGAVGFNNNSAYNGGAIYGGNNSTIMLSGNGSLEFSDNTSSLYGGAIYGASSSKIMLSYNETVSFRGNSTTQSSNIYGGGAIYGNSNSTITISNNGSVAFSENTASNGGAIYGANNSKIMLSENESLTFSDNTGAILGGNDSTITLSDNVSVLFSGNTEDRGGAISVEDDSSITLSGNASVTFSGNSASPSGGAINGGRNSTVSLSGNGSVTFSGNTASKSSYYGNAFDDAAGGAIDGSTIELNGNGSVTFSENTAKIGGAIYAYSNVDLSSNGSVTFSGNSASSYGGAIYGNSGSTIELSGNGSVEFSGNSSSTTGGAIYGVGLASLNGNDSVVFRGNMASTSGGAISGGTNSTITLSGNGSVEFSGNSASKNGGAIYAYDGSTLILSENNSVAFNRNSATFGGAILGANGEIGCTITLSGNGSVSFGDNTASNCGGAIVGASGSSIVLSDNDSVSFDDNTASYYGGAISVENNGKITLSGNKNVSFDGNSASINGGAIYAYDGSTLILSENNSVAFNGNSATFGGAILGANGEIGCTITLSGNGSVSFGDNTASNCGGAIVGASGSSIVLSDNDSVSFYDNTASHLGGAISVESNGKMTLSGNKNVSFDGNSARAGSAIYTYSGGTIELIGNGSVTFNANTATSAGGAIYGQSSIELRGNGSVVFNENMASGSGGALYVGNSLELSGNGSVEFSGNTSSASGGAIRGASGSTIELSSNGNVTFSGNVTSSNAYYGGAIQTGGNLSIRNNDKVLFEKNAYISNGAYYLRALYADGSEAEISLSAAAGGNIEFRDSVCIVSDLELNADYTDAAGVVHRQAGDIIFTGATTEADLLAVKGSAGTASEILNSRTSEIGGNINLYGGRLRVEDGAILALNGEVIVADNSDATLILKDGTLRGGINVASGGTLSLTGENIISLGNRNLTMADGSCLQMELGAVNMDGNAVLSTTGSLKMDYITFVLSDSEYLETGKYKLLTRKEGTDYDISGWTLLGAAANQLTWENGTLYYNGGHDWNHVVKGGDEVQDSYTGNLIVKDGSVTLDKSVTVNAVDGVEKTGHLVVDKANLTVTAESSVRAEVIVKDGTLHNEGSMEDSITLMGGKVSGSGVFAGIDMTAGKLVVGNSPGMQRYTDAVNLSGGTVVFSVAGVEAASAGNRGWGSATYSTLDMQGNILTFGEDVTIEVAFGGEGLVSVLTATDANPYTLQMSLAQNVGNAAAYTQEVLAALASQTTFVVTEEASGIAGCITLAPGESLADIVKSYSYSMSGDTLVLSVTLAGNGKGVHAVPEPTTATLSLLALAALAARRRRKM